MNINPIPSSPQSSTSLATKGSLSLANQTSIKVDERTMIAATPLRGALSAEGKAISSRKIIPLTRVIKSKLVFEVSQISKASDQAVFGIKNREKVQEYLSSCWASIKTKFDSLYLDQR